MFQYRKWTWVSLLVAVFFLPSIVLAAAGDGGTGGFELSPQLIAVLAMAAVQVIKFLWEKIGGNLPFWIKPIMSAVVGAIIAWLESVITQAPPTVTPMTGFVAGAAGSKFYDYAIAMYRKDDLPLKSSV